MKTRSLILIIGAAALTAMTINATASDVLLSPRAAGNQIKHFAGIYNDPNLVSVDHYTVVISPRAYGNQFSTIAGIHNDVNPPAACAKTMTGTPKMVTECASHSTMPGCVTVAPLK